jgi:serine protease inhibitor
MVQALKPEKPSISTINEQCKSLVALLGKGHEAKLNVANAVFTRAMATKEFEKNAIDYFDARAEELIDAEQVNNWIAKKTNDKIKDMVKEINGGVKAILIAAVFFQSQWAQTFDKKKHKQTFHTKQNGPVEVDFFYRNYLDGFYYEAERVKGVGIPLKDGFNFMILMPDDNIDSYAASLTQQKMDSIIKTFKYGTVNVKLPEFSFEFEENLIPILQEMGVKQAFTETAEFGNLSTEDKVFISKVQHNNFIKVSHKGVEASSATVEVMYLSSKPDPMADVVIDKPFVFGIKHSKANDFIFLGKVEKI